MYSFVGCFSSSKVLACTCIILLHVLVCFSQLDFTIHSMYFFIILHDLFGSYQLSLTPGQ